MRQGAGPLEGCEVVGVVGEVGGVQHQGVGQLVGVTGLQQRAPVQHAANRRWLQRKIFRRCVKNISFTCWRGWRTAA